MIESHFNRAAFFGCLLVSSIVLEGNCIAQADGGRTINALPVKILVPAYPRLAQQARIAGDVNLVLTIGKGGLVESVSVLDGHAMLRQVAIESARRSLFDCPSCDDHSASYSLRYRFQINPLSPERACSGAEPDPPVELDLSEHLVTISAWEVWICDPAVTIKRYRSPKCLYLWRCGRHEFVNQPN